MKSISLLLCIIFILSCSQNKTNKTVELAIADTTNTLSIILAKKDICWAGSIEKNVPVFIHYQTDSNIISGEIIYLNTKERKPIKLIGTIDKNKELSWLEFEAGGNITGILYGTMKDNNITGSWFSPKASKTLSLSLAAKDTIINSENLEPARHNIFGKYFYQYSEEGPQGIFNIDKLNKDSIVFELTATTSAPARNIAEIPADTVLLKNNYLKYAVPENAGCVLGIKFYKGFVYVYYVKDDCQESFGHNATAEGIYLKL